MGSPAANGMSMVVATDTHIVMVPSPGGPIPTPLPHLFMGPINAALVPTVTVAGQPAATVGSIATNQVPHIPTPPGTAFMRPPTNQGTVQIGSTSVLIGGQPAARHGDTASTCNDPVDAPVGTVIAPNPTVMLG